MTDREKTTLTRDTWIIHVAVVLSYFGKATVKGVSGFLLNRNRFCQDRFNSFGFLFSFCFGKVSHTAFL